jgi:hypothetical protein
MKCLCLAYTNKGNGNLSVPSANGDLPTGCVNDVPGKRKAPLSGANGDVDLTSPKTTISWKRSYY